MRTLVVAHVYYPQFWPELACCIRNIDGMRDLIVTYVDEASVVGAKRDFPTARFFLSENRGFDIWPFLQAVATVDLSVYDCIVKLHTKRDVEKECDWYFNNCRFNGSLWRNHLLAFCRTAEAWRRTRTRLSEPGTGMVADRHVIVRRRDFPWASVRSCFDDAVADIRSIPGCKPFDARTAQYVSGTMFAMRPEPLAFLLKKTFSPEMFDVSSHDREGQIVYAYRVENLFGLAVSAVGMRLDAFNGSLGWRRIYAPLLKALFRVKETRRRQMVKVFGVPVLWRTKEHPVAWPGLILAAAMLAWMCLAVWFVSSRTTSADENRTLAERPEFAKALDADYGYGARFDRWLGDHFPKRKKMVQLSNGLRMRGNSRVRSGPDGWLYGTVLGAPEVFTHANRFTESELACLRERTVAFGRDAHAAGVKRVYFIFSNDKESIYPEFYPPGYAKVHPESRFEQTWRALRNATPDVALLRFTDRLLALKSEHTVFCKSGTHMTDLASYRVYGWLAERIRADFSDFVQVRDEDCVFGRDSRHTDDDLVKLGAVPLYSSEFLENDFAELKSPKARITQEEHRRDGFLRVVRRFSNPTVGGGLRLFLLTDSFGRRWIPYLAESVSELQTVFIGNNDPYVLDAATRADVLSFKPDIVVVNFTERFLQRLLTLEFPKDMR